MKRWSRRAGLVAALAAAGCGPADDTWEVHGTLERDRLELVAESHERISEIPVREGERVAPEAVLVRQEAGTMQPRLDQAHATLQESERRLAELERGPRQQEIGEARAALDGAVSTLETESREYERVRSLVERKLLSASELDRARARRDAARSSRDQARARLDLLREGTRVEQVEQAQAGVARARAALAELETTAARYVVRVPRPGIVEALPYEVGERPPAGAVVAVVLADGTPYARVYVPEPLRAAYTAGTAVQLRVDGVGSTLQGTVRYVSAEASFTPYYSLTQKDRTRLSYLAEITVDDSRAAALPAGVPVQVTLAGAP
jgi:HlyD family secretion protein